MTVLGWHGGVIREFEDSVPGWSTHDAAAVILKDGNIIAAIEEERLNRIKHSNHFPFNAIQACLNQAGITLHDIDIIAMNFKERDREVIPCDQGLPAVERYLDDTNKDCITIKDSVAEIFNREFSCDISNKLFFCDHHEAHLWSAFACSGFSSALIVSIDGSGDCKSGSFAVGDYSGLSILRTMEIEDSIGNFYSDTIRLLGYKRFDEYKAMGLAPYGDPSIFRELFQRMYILLPEGNIKLLPRKDRWSLFFDAGLIHLARRAKDEFNEVHKNIAAALQETTEELVFHILRYFQRVTHTTKLCLSGGVAHNCTLNGKILKAGLFKDIFVQPAAHDAGGALGAAISVVEAKGSKEARRVLKHLYLGKKLEDSVKIHQLVVDWGEIIHHVTSNNPAFDAAELIASGNVIGWIQGASEFGPRALGNRSILADPRPLSNRDRVNKLIKKREGFRPFAPSILEESIDEIVMDKVGEADLSFMTFALTIKSNFRPILGAVTHVDGSARVQSVSKDINPRFWDLIDNFRKITGMPVVLNTSFNNDMEPIVDSVDDAIGCFLTTGLDALIIDNIIIKKKDLHTHTELLTNLLVRLPKSKKLVSRVDELGKQIYLIESTTSKYFGQQKVLISYDIFNWLSIGNNRLLHDIFEANSKKFVEMVTEILELWSKRFLLLKPKR